MNILSLPIDILLFLFNSKFSLQELLHLRGICRHLSNLIESEHCIGSRKILKIFWSFKDILCYSCNWYPCSLEEIDELQFREIGSNDDDLVLNACTFSECTCDLLVRLFPRVHHLMVYFTAPKKYPDYLILTHLFNKWTDQLTGLSLIGQFFHSSIAPENSIEQNSVARLKFCRAINQLRTLKRFDMCLDNLFCNDNSIWRKIEQTKLLLPAKLDQILPRLERLCFIHKSLDFSQNVVRHLGPHCTRLSLSFVGLPKGELREALDQTIMTNGTAFRLTYLKLTQDYLFILSDINGHTQLSALESLTLSQCHEASYRVDLVLSKLVPLKRLTSLKMVMFDFTILQCPNTVLSQITSLSMFLSNHKMEDPFTWLTGLSYIFPFVDKFTLYIIRTLNIAFKEGIPPQWIQFPRCTQFWLLTKNCNNNNGTFKGVLSRHRRVRFEREYEMLPISTSDSTEKYDTMQKWKRRDINSQWVEMIN